MDDSDYSAIVILLLVSVILQTANLVVGIFNG